jgi:hypothetical protein
MLLTFPPHCSHALQPLDVCVYSLFKRALGKSYNEWLQLNPGKLLILKEIAELTRSAYVAAFTPANIISAFVSTGILPFNRLAIADERYAPSLITDRDCPIGNNFILFLFLISQVLKLFCSLSVGHFGRGSFLFEFFVPLRKNTHRTPKLMVINCTISHDKQKTPSQFLDILCKHISCWKIIRSP